MFIFGVGVGLDWKRLVANRDGKRYGRVWFVEGNNNSLSILHWMFGCSNVDNPGKFDFLHEVLHFKLVSKEQSLGQ